jgi:hypothetical protein
MTTIEEVTGKEIDDRVLEALVRHKVRDPNFLKQLWTPEEKRRRMRQMQEWVIEALKRPVAH